MTLPEPRELDEIAERYQSLQLEGTYLALCMLYAVDRFEDFIDWLKKGEPGDDPITVAARMQKAEEIKAESLRMIVLKVTESSLMAKVHHDMYHGAADELRRNLS